MGTPQVVAGEVDRMFNYLNRFHVRNHEGTPTVQEKVLEGWALMDWSGIVKTILAPCNQSMRTDPILVHEIVKRLAEYLPTSAYFAMRKLNQLELKAMTVIISGSANLYSHRNGIGPVP